MENLIKNFAEIDAKSTKRYYLGADEECKESLLLCDMNALSEFLQAFALVPKDETLQILDKVEGHELYKKRLFSALLLFTETCERWGSIAEDIADYIRDTKQI